MPFRELAPRYIAVTGTDASGKDTYAYHLEQFGFMHVSAGDVLRDEARAQGHKEPLPRSVLSKVGDEFKIRYGATPITLSVIERHRKLNADFPAGLVISGLRRVAEVHAFKQLGAQVLYFDAEPAVRFQRQSRRVGREKAATLEDFVQYGQKEYLGFTEAGTKGVYLQGVEQLADIKLLNNTTIEGLIQQADAYLGL